MKLKHSWYIETVVIVALIIACQSGCSRVYHVSVEECQKESKPKIVGLITTSGQEIKMNGGHCELFSQSFIGMDEDGNPLLIQSDSVMAVEIKKLDKLATAVAVVGVVSAIAIAEILFVRAAIDNTLPWW
jgi:hypothetical protein